MKKRKLPMAPVLLGALCLLLLAVFGMVQLVRHEAEKDIVTTSDPSKVRELIRTLPVDKATGITLSANGKTTVRLSLSDGKWILSSDPETPVQQSMITSMLSNMDVLLALRKIGRGDLSEYGLDTPSATLTLSCREESYCLCFGNYNGSYNGYYFRLDESDTVYIVESDLYLFAAMERDDLLTLPELPDRSDIDSVTLNYPDGRVLTISGDTTDPEEADLIACLASLELSHRVDYGHSSDRIYGLDAPVRADLVTGTGERLLLHLGRGESEKFIYLRIGQSAAVYVFTADHTDVLLSYLDKIPEES